MKPIRTWIVVANARLARIIEHNGVGHGLHAVPGKVLKAEAPVEYADRPGTGRSIAGPGTNAIERADPQDHANLVFAKTINDTLGEALDTEKFDRLIVIAAPHMMGLLRKVLKPALTDVLLGEVDKDLAHLPLEQIERHLQDVFLV